MRLHQRTGRKGQLAVQQLRHSASSEVHKAGYRRHEQHVVDVYRVIAIEIVRSRVPAHVRPESLVSGKSLSRWSANSASVGGSGRVLSEATSADL